MKRGEKSGEGAEKKGENLGEKLRRGVFLVGNNNKRGGQHTPVLPPWRLLLPLHLSSSAGGGGDGEVPPPPSSVSARKLAATLWELHHYSLPLSKVMLGTTSSLRRHIASSLTQHHRSTERNNHAIQPVSPASYGSSMEVAPYNPAIAPTSSLDFKGRIGETSYSLKTSTELLKVLNRIWSLEEQHTLLIKRNKELKRERDHARARIKELVGDQQADRHMIKDLRNQVAEIKLVRKSKEQDRISTTIQSVNNELEDERKLRKHSEGLQRKLAQEFYEVNISRANALKELERERKSGKLLENLCDEFAWGIRDYEQKSDRDLVDGADGDRLIARISELWLEERMRMKLVEGQYGVGEKNSVVDKLSSEIETFLLTKRTDNSKINDNLVPRGPNFRRSSLESIPLNAAASAPRDVGDEVDSSGGDSHCFELDKPNSGGLKAGENEPKDNHTCEGVKPNHTKKILTSSEKLKGQVKFEEQMDQSISRYESKPQVANTKQWKTADCNPVEASTSRKSEICEVTQNNDLETHESKSNDIIDDLRRSQYMSSEYRNMNLESYYGLASSGNSVWKRNASPVRQWTDTLPSQNLEISESSSKLPPGIKENTLKAKLLEARARSQRPRSRLTSSKASF